MSKGVAFFVNHSRELSAEFAGQLAAAVARANASPMTDVHTKAFALTAHIALSLPMMLSSDTGDLLVIILNVVDSQNAAVGHRRAGLAVLRSLVQEPQHIIDVFANYDCNSTTSVRLSFTAITARLVGVVLDPLQDALLRNECAECVRATAESFGLWIDRFDADFADAPLSEPSPSPVGGDTPPMALERPEYDIASALERKRTVARCLAAFNTGNTVVALQTLDELRAPPAKGQDAAPGRSGRVLRLAAL